MKKIASAFTLLSFLIGFSASAADRVVISGAGASFPAPLYTKWFDAYNKANPNIEINYQSIGSGGGIKNLLAKTVDFGASDAPMTDAELKSSAVPVLHIPTVMGAVVITYNLPEVTKPIKMTSALIAEIFMGKVTNWNDPKIAAVNKGVVFPSLPIPVAYRSDSSGTTAVFTEYLAKVNEEWKTVVGQGKTVKWPVGIGGKGNEGVTGFVKNTKGSLGYVEFTYAESQKLPVAEIQNKAGQFVAPTVKAVSEAAAAAVKAMPEDMRISITNADGKTAYPISAFTYLLVYQTMEKTKGGEIVRFIDWAMGTGQGMAPALSYAPLPKPLLAKVKEKAKKITLQ